MSNGAERIIRRVMEDAETGAEKIKKEASDKARALENDARQKAEKKRDHILEQARKAAVEQKGRIIGVAQLDTRKKLLAAKQEMIGVAFEKALEEMASLNDSDYFDIIQQLLIATAETGKEAVIMSESDKKRVPADFLTKVNKQISGNGRVGNLNLSEESRDIKGGFILQRGGLEMNCSFESLLEMKREELEHDVAELLFN